MENVLPSSLLLLILLTIILCFSPQIISTAADDDPSPYLFPSTLSTNYQRMVSSLKIFPYALNLTTAPSLFHTSLLSSPFITSNPWSASLFYLPTPPDLPNRSLDRLISHLRSSLPFWNRSLAADHFFLSSSGSSASPSSSRNVVELRKNAVRVSSFSSPASSYFVPHKDASLPPLARSRSSLNRTRSSPINYKYLGFFNSTATVRVGAELIQGLRGDPDFLIESGPLNDGVAYLDTRFCLFVYQLGEGDQVVGLGEALASGCVPVVITDRPIQDMPLMDVLSWHQIALFVGTDVGPPRLKRILTDLLGGDNYNRMKRLGVAAAKHLAWNDPPQPYDAFHMVMYQLWLRSHAVRYATWEFW